MEDRAGQFDQLPLHWLAASLTHIQAFLNKIRVMRCQPSQAPPCSPSHRPPSRPPECNKHQRSNSRTPCKFSEPTGNTFRSGQVRSVSHLVVLLADQLVHEGEVGALEVVPAHSALQHNVRSDVIVTHLQSAHLHAVFMEIFSV